MAAEGGRAGVTFRWGLAALAATFPAYLLYSHFGSPGGGRAAWFALLMLALAVRRRWVLREHVWFWVTVTLICVVEASAIWYIPWTARWLPAALILPFAIADLVAVSFVIDAVGKRMTPSR